MPAAALVLFAERIMKTAGVCLNNKHFDYIYCFPAFGSLGAFGEAAEPGGESLTSESEGIAIENILKHLTESGELVSKRR